MKIERHETGPRMSKVVIHGDTVYLAGIVADSPKGKSTAEQTRMAERIAHLSASRQPTGLCQKQSHVLFCLDSLWVKSQNYNDRNAIPER